MIIYFSKATENEEFEDLYYYNGEYYYYQLDLDEKTGNITIYDTCNRAMPFDEDQFSSLLNALAYAFELKNLKSSLDEEFNSRIEQLATQYNFKA